MPPLATMKSTLCPFDAAQRRRIEQVQVPVLRRSRRRSSRASRPGPRCTTGLTEPMSASALSIACQRGVGRGSRSFGARAEAGDAHDLLAVLVRGRRRRRCGCRSPRRRRCRRTPCPRPPRSPRPARPSPSRPRIVGFAALMPITQPWYGPQSPTWPPYATYSVPPTSDSALRWFCGLRHERRFPRPGPSIRRPASRTSRCRRRWTARAPRGRDDRVRPDRARDVHRPRGRVDHRRADDAERVDAAAARRRCRWSASCRCCASTSPRRSSRRARTRRFRS